MVANFWVGAKICPVAQANGPSASSGQARQTAVQAFSLSTGGAVEPSIEYFTLLRVAKPQDPPLAVFRWQWRGCRASVDNFKAVTLRVNP